MDDKEKELHLDVLHSLMDAIGHAAVTPFMSREPKDGVVVTKEVHKEIPLKGIMSESEKPMEMAEEESPAEETMHSDEKAEPDEDKMFKPRWMKK